MTTLYTLIYHGKCALKDPTRTRTAYACTISQLVLRAAATATATATARPARRLLLRLPLNVLQRLCLHGGEPQNKKSLL